MDRSKLTKRHQTYLLKLPTWQVISDLKEGAYLLLSNPQKYIPRRPGETDDLYCLRLAKTSYTPILADSIRRFASKLVDTTIEIQGRTNTEFWDKFERQETITARMYSSLSTALYYGSSYIGILPQYITNNRLTQSQALPQWLLYEPRSVINWGKGWFITESSQVVQESPELDEDTVETTWVVWETGRTRSFMAKGDSTPTLVFDIRHEGCLLIPMTLPQELWTGNNVYSKQLQHFRIESAWTDTGSMMHIQRTFNPPQQGEFDPRLHNLQGAKFDNAHVAIGEFDFSESSGSTINALTGQLQTIENQIRTLVNIQFSASSNKGSQYQSSLSKRADMSLVNATMSTYGSIISNCLELSLCTVSKVAGLNEDITVKGLKNYESDDLTELLTQVEPISKVEERLDPSSVSAFYKRIDDAIAG